MNAVKMRLRVTGTLHTPSTPGMGSKGQNVFLLNIVMLHIKLNGMEYRATCKHIFCPYTHPQSPDGVKRPTHLFSESSHVAYQIKGN